MGRKQRGFFALSTLMAAKKPLPMVADCANCRLCNGCNTPFMKPSGEGKKKILVVGQAPRANEDDKGQPFVGADGRDVRSIISSCGLDSEVDVRWTNALICRPPHDRIKDERAVEYCRPNLIKTIEEFKPKVIILLGPTAVKSLIGFLWKEDVGGLNPWVGWKIPAQRFNAWICPTWHPSYLREKEHPVRNMMFAEQIKEAVLTTKRPWKDIPDFKSQVEVIFDTDKAAQLIDKFARSKRPVAFDYETNMLKPDIDRAKIVCCSLSDGKRTIAFPWCGRVIEAMRRFLRSRVRKIASNMKFEHRWSLAKLKVQVRNWYKDTMLKSHVLDNRPGINSIKFQAFVRLGQESYDEHIKPFLKSEGGGYDENRIDEVDPHDLMVYCGLDSLLEWWVASLQHKEMNRDRSEG